MSAQFRIFASDQQTVITTENLGNILSPGSSSNVKMYLQNFGNQTANSVLISINPLAGNDGNLYAYLAVDSNGSPGPFGPGPLSVGSSSVLSMTPFWTNVQLIAGLTPDGNPRRYSIVCSGTST